MSRYLCTHCKAPTAVADLRCPACGRGYLEEARIDAARSSTEAIVRALSGDPYLRSAGLLAYTLRSHVRGFLDDPAHPLVRRLLRHLHDLAGLAGECAMRQLLPHAERHWVRPRAPVLARALRYVRERHAEAIEAAARGDASAVEFESWYRDWIERDDSASHSM